MSEPRTPHYKRSIEWMLEYEKPDDSTTVLVAWTDDDTEVGYWDSESDCWRNLHGERFHKMPDYWAHLPALPMDPEDKP